MTQVFSKDLSWVKPNARNTRKHPPAQIEAIKRSLQTFGWTIPLLALADGTLIAGHARTEAALSLVAAGSTDFLKVPVIIVDDWDDAKVRAYMIVDNRLAEQSEWDVDLLREEVSWLAAGGVYNDVIGFSDADFIDPIIVDDVLVDDPAPTRKAGSLSDAFGIAPFSVLNAREGWWQDRKRGGLALGLRSEAGRGENLIKRSPQEMLSLIRGGHYSDNRAYLEAGRAAGLTDEQILDKARTESGFVAPAVDASPLLFKNAAVNEAGLNHYRNKAKAAKPGPATAFASQSTLNKYRTAPAATPAGLALNAVPNYDGADREVTGTSIFDPVLCELAYRWFSPPGGTVLDPFAGGSVRGIVAAATGRQYWGVDLSPYQIAANQAQWDDIGPRLTDAPPPVWIRGDSRQRVADPDVAPDGADMVFSCPPYADLEVYSDDPQDLSTMDYGDFKTAYGDIIKAAVDKLKPDRFACFVVGEVRGPDGAYLNFVADTIAAFEAAGARYYNEMILITMVGTLPVRAGRQFAAGRKIGKTHQNVLVFVKGDSKRATAACGPVDFSALPEFIDPDADQPKPPRPDFTPDLTPIEDKGGVWAKRDDLWVLGGAVGGKARTCWAIAQGATGLTTAGSRSSPQINIVAHIAARLGVPFRAHCPTGVLSPELVAAQAAGAEIVPHKAGYNTVIVARAAKDAADRGWTCVPFGMECDAAVAENRRQVRDIPAGVKRIVIAVGSGMSLCGVLWGLKDAGLSIPVLGVVVGADPIKRLDKYAPPDWADMVELVPSGVDYHDAVAVNWRGIDLDPHYEAKAARFVADGDLFWIVGVRASL